MDDTRIILQKERKRQGYIFTLKCLKCSKIFQILGYKFNDGQGKYCSLLCANSSDLRIQNLKAALPDFNGKRNPNYKDGRCSYVKNRKPFCEFCGKGNDEFIKKRKNPLEVHHIDKDRTNANVFNLMTACISCHKKIHKNYEERRCPKTGRFL